MTNDIRVPAGAERLLGLLIPDIELRDAVLGDLREEHHRIALTESVAAADLWYRSEAMRSFSSFAALPLLACKAGDWTRFAAGAAIGYVVLVGSMIVSLGAIGWIGDLFTGNGYASSLLAFALIPGAIAMWALLLAGVGGMAAGAVMARVGGRAAMVAVLTVGLFGVPGLAVTVEPDIMAAPLWFQFLLSTMLFVSAIRGAAWLLEEARR